MRIVVPIKQVPETSNVKMDEKTGTMVREGVESIINPLDLYAIEEAILLKQQLGGEVIVISMGPPKAIEAIKEAIAMGCDGGYLISDRKFAGSDTWATSKILSSFIKKKLEFDIVIAGERATDGDTGQVGPGIASFLDIPALTYVASIDVENENTFVVKRLVENGYEFYKVKAPVLFTVVKEIADPRLPTFRGKIKAKKTEVPVISNEFLNLTDDEIGLKGSPTRVVKIFKPKVSREGEKFIVKSDRDIPVAVDKIVDYLKENNFI